jgi:hypothetical protein
MKRKMMMFAALVAAASTVGVAAASASQTFTSAIYGNTTFTCSSGSTDTSGASYGTFMAIETQHNQLVNASVTVDNLYPNRWYKVSVTESGHSCLTDHNAAWLFMTNSHSQAVFHFQFWAHTGETSAWVTLQHGSTNDIYRSTALPINR